MFVPKNHNLISQKYKYHSNSLWAWSSEKPMSIKAPAKIDQNITAIYALLNWISLLETFISPDINVFRGGSNIRSFT